MDVFSFVLDAKAHSCETQRSSLEVHVAKRIFEHTRGSQCLICEEGKLIVQSMSTVDASAELAKLIFERTKIKLERIMSLCCNACGIQYAAAERGQIIHDILEVQLKGYKNPPILLESCPCCFNTELKRGKTRSLIQEANCEYYRYCPDCLNVLYSEFPEPRVPTRGPLPIVDQVTVPQKNATYDIRPDRVRKT